ncbi:MAG: MBL fold metallo-hydrolase [Syntrophorhabdus sp.]
MKTKELAHGAGPDQRTVTFSQTGVKGDIGLCKSVKITCLSETSWFDGNVLMKDMERAGGRQTSQWAVDWNETNSGGYSSLIEVEDIDENRFTFLLDAGWNTTYMDRVFERENIPRMLENDQIQFLYLTHEHFDHFFGIESVLKWNPAITVIIPDTFDDEGYRLLKGEHRHGSNAKNAVPHVGKLVRHEPGRIYQLYPGCASVTFDTDIPFRVRGEQSLFFNVKDKGIICVTGCCHQNILGMTEFARQNIEGGENLYGLYGGLHIAMTGPLDSEGERIINRLGSLGFRKIACNHCTGINAVQKMLELGYPVVKGSAMHGSLSDMYIGNGDVIVF